MTGAAGPGNEDEDAVAEIRDNYRVPSRLFKELERRNALPGWAGRTDDLKRDWLAEFHESSKIFPELGTQAFSLELANFLARADPERLAINMPLSTPAFLRVLV